MSTRVSRSRGWRPSQGSSRPGWGSGGAVNGDGPTTVGDADHEERALKMKPAARITGRLRQQVAVDLKKKYEKGASIRSLAASTGRSYGFVHKILTESGVQLRGRGGVTRGRARRRR
nr:hypothetical protein GCM10020241_35180 [Streptoalloteichus tenebrarius]